MLRIYKLPSGKTYQFEEGEQPKDAILVEMAAPAVITPETTPKPKTTRKRTTRKKSQE